MEIRDVDLAAQVNINISRPIKVIHFSDGIEEEIEEVTANNLDCAPKSEHNVDTATLSWGPWISHYAKKSGTKVLNAVDYAGESLAHFFGITTPKYQIEIDEYERMEEEKKKIEDESAGWVAKNSDGNIPLVLNRYACCARVFGDVRLAAMCGAEPVCEAARAESDAEFWRQPGHSIFEFKGVCLKSTIGI
ncbi:unnamed protein product, partial [Iphiclides podalirius]